MLANLFGGEPRARFWKWFQQNADRLAAVKSGQDPILGKLTRELRRVDPRLTFEIGVGDDKQMEFIVSADGVRDVFPAVEQLVACAPAVPGWKIIGFRQPQAAIPAIKFNGVSLRAEDIWFSHKQRAGKVDLVLYVRGFSEPNARTILGAAFILLDHALGEYFAATGLGVIDYQLLPENPELRGLHPLAEIGSMLLAQQS